MNILIIAEVNDGVLSPASAELFTAARAISADADINAVALGSGIGSSVAILSSLSVSRVFTAEAQNLTSALAASFIQKAVAESGPGVILMTENDLGADLAPQLAVRLNTAAVTGIVAVRVENDQAVFTRPVYGGNALADFTIESEPQIVSIRPKAFAPAAEVGNHTAEVFELAAEPPAGVRVLERVAVQQQGPKIEEAKIVVGGGRGLGGPEGFAQLKQLADLIGGVVGASRPPCDQGWWPESGQIGITGKIISPDLYIAVGISGSSQHVSGVSGSKTIVAINKDTEANIFKVATYGVTGDWKKVIPSFTAKIKELTGR
ncbi:electron transfer flavoprotein subunit alpha/FixB family protein [Dehalogenimonas etheniformans]|uniref:Electron transfer flavoprotein subunit alpha/FixB family protein n=1 Tax=Dehalogenimonas etheniformans TaxID=1536648 RepID=A0A2P5P8F5_9CHLR|nr:electron transfer flavoprotein subunit alpha/FixB family protein [Dehalogenimonas etheniformans]PPD58577.1 electron transfer flavoprotein subunit alpha/FixB family protein [Dehalogenimonas etheniformans]QNT76659.1 electron transfer flavoprotein subunit alpha/FixB family protein [Dehalogenimonas etheniformans]